MCNLFCLLIKCEFPLLHRLIYIGTGAIRFEFSNVLINPVSVCACLHVWFLLQQRQDAVNVFRLTHIFDNDDDENFVFMDMIIACERNV